MAKEGQTGLEAITAALGRGGKGPPPVERWNPPFCGDLDMRIAADGTCIYLRRRSGGLVLAKLFASVPSARATNLPRDPRREVRHLRL